MKIIRKEGDVIVLYDSEGERVLGRFPFGPGEKYKNEETAREAAAEREREIQFFAHRGMDELWVTTEQMRVICPECAEKMEAQGLTRVNLAELKAMPAELLAGLCDRIGGSFDTCMGMSLGDFAPRDKESFCAWLHRECTGKWPSQQAATNPVPPTTITAENVTINLITDNVDLANPQELSRAMAAPDPRKSYPLRALGDGWVEGAAVVFSPGGEPKDSFGEFFEGDTYFGWKGEGPREAMYQHGLDPMLGKRLLGLNGTGFVKSREDEVALWVKHQLDIRNEWEAAIYAMTEDGKLSLSTGTAEHTIIRLPTGKLAQWLITEISYTPTPAEPRTVVAPVRSLTAIPLKSLMPPRGDRRSGPGVQTGQGETDRLRGIEIRGDMTMFKKEDLIHNIMQFTGVADETAERLKGVLMLTSEKTIKDIEQVMGHIQALVPELSEEQLDQIRHVIAMMVPELNEGAAPADEGPPPIEAATPPPALSAPPAVPPVAPAARPQRNVPYTFRPTQPPAGDINRDVNFLRYQGPEINEVDGRVMKSVYGADYRQLTLEQQDAFWSYVRTGRESPPLHRQIWHIKHVRSMMQAGASVVQIRANMIEGQGILGGYAVPPQVADNILIQASGLAVVRQAGALIVQTTSNMIQWVVVTGGNSRYPSALRGLWEGETAAPTADEFNIGLESIPVFIYTYKTPFSVSLLEDAANLEDVFVQLVGETLAMDEDDAFLVGDGAGKPTGIMPSQIAPTTITLQAVGTGTADEITWAGLQAVRRGMYAQFRQNGSFVGNSATGGLIERLVDGESRPYLESLDVGEKLLRRTWYESEALADVGTGSYPVIFGDFSGYAIVERLGMAMQRYNDSNTGINLVEFHIRRRIGGRIIQPYKFALLRCNATLGNL